MTSDATDALRQLSAARALDQSTLWRYEAGERRPRGPAAVAWARGLQDLLACSGCV